MVCFPEFFLFNAGNRQHINIIWRCKYQIGFSAHIFFIFLDSFGFHFRHQANSKVGTRNSIPLPHEIGCIVGMEKYFALEILWDILESFIMIQKYGIVLLSYRSHIFFELVRPRAKYIQRNTLNITFD